MKSLLKSVIYTGLLGLSISINCRAMEEITKAVQFLNSKDNDKNYSLERFKKIELKYNEYCKGHSGKELGNLVGYSVNKIVFQLKNDPNKCVVFENGSGNNTEFSSLMDTSCIVEFLSKFNKNKEIPNTAKIYSFVDNREGELANFTDFNIWYEMDFINGYNLDNYFSDTRNKCTCKQVIEWSLQLCSALQKFSKDGWTFTKLDMSDIRLKPNGHTVVITNFSKIANIKDLNNNRLKKLNELSLIPNNSNEIKKYEKEIKDQNAYHLCKLISKLSEYVSKEDIEAHKDTWDKLNLFNEKTLNNVKEKIIEISLEYTKPSCLVF